MTLLGRSGQRGAAPDARLAGRDRMSSGHSGNRSVLVTVPVTGARARTLTLAAGLERVAAAAGGGGVRVLDREAAAHQVFLVVDLGAFQVPHAHGIDDDLDPVLLEDFVAVRDLVEDHPVLEPGTATALDINPEAALGQVGLFLLQYRLDLFRRSGSDIDHSRLLLAILHINGFEGGLKGRHNPAVEAGELITR